MLFPHQIQLKCPIKKTQGILLVFSQEMDLGDHHVQCPTDLSHLRRVDATGRRATHVGQTSVRVSSCLSGMHIQVEALLSSCGSHVKGFVSTVGNWGSKQKADGTWTWELLGGTFVTFLGGLLASINQG